jgi:hypothetical protein
MSRNDKTAIPANFDFMSRDDVVLYKLGRIESLLDAVKDNQEKHAATDELFHAAMEKRTASLERSRSYAFGIIATISVIGTVLTNFMSRYMGFPHA